VLDNVRIGGHATCRSDFLSDALRLPWIRRRERSLEQTAWALLDSLDYIGTAEQGGHPRLLGKPRERAA